MDETKQMIDGAIKTHELKYHTRPNKVGRIKPKRYSDEFEVFWGKFRGRWSVDKDKHVKVGKYSAWEVWKKMTTAEQQKATRVADRVTGKYVPDPSRWLKRKLFDDFN